MAEGWSVATVLLPGQSGEFWLLQTDESDRQEWVVVRPGSTRKWRVILPEQFVLRAVHDGRLYGVARDELDVPRVVAFADPRMVQLGHSAKDPWLSLQPGHALLLVCSPVIDELPQFPAQPPRPVADLGRPVPPQRLKRGLVAGVMIRQ